MQQAERLISSSTGTGNNMENKAATIHLRYKGFDLEDGEFSLVEVCCCRPVAVMFSVFYSAQFCHFNDI